MSIYFKHDGFASESKKIKHGFFGSQGGVSRGLYSSLNCGLGSEDDTVNVRTNRRNALEALGLQEELRLVGVSDSTRAEMKQP